VDHSRAVLISARRAQIEIDQLLASGLLSRHEHAERRAAFQRDIIAAERTLHAAAVHSHQEVVLPAVLSAQKSALLDAARRGLITERTAGEHVAALDKRFLEASADEHSVEHTP
jgi:CPA1 family monovalent cation:H+ antiporter